MKTLSIVSCVALLVVIASAAPEGHQKGADAAVHQKQEKLHHHDGSTEDLAEDEEQASAAADHEFSRVRRSIIGAVSDALHGKSKTVKLVAIPLTHGVKTGVKLGVKHEASKFKLSSLVPVSVVAKVTKVAKLTAPIVAPVVGKLHFAGKFLHAKSKVVGAVVHHKVSKVADFF